MVLLKGIKPEVGMNVLSRMGLGTLTSTHDDYEIDMCDDLCDSFCFRAQRNEFRVVDLSEESENDDLLALYYVLQDAIDKDIYRFNQDDDDYYHNLRSRVISKLMRG